MQPRLFGKNNVEEVSAGITLKTPDELIQRMQNAADDLQRAYLLADVANAVNGTQLISDAYKLLKETYAAGEHIKPQIKGVSDNLDEDIEKKLQLASTILKMMESFVNKIIDQPRITF